tara:strand:- start:186 stop:440 length:255 start_codon:yes stop_codon:yes gene_type:complete
MLYQLPNGHTIELSLDDYLNFSDEELKSLNGTNYGLQLNNPMFGTVINKPGKPDKEKPIISENDIYNISTEDKIQDQDFKLDEE